jgi:hypothetical protein
MNRRVTQLIQLLMAIALLLIPSIAVPLSAAMGSESKLACCGSECPCPPDKVCTGDRVPVPDRTVAQSQPDVSSRISVALYSLPTERESSSSQAVSLAQTEAKAPPLILGSPPEAKLCVWIL